MQLVPIITEIQCNIVDNVNNINTRKAVFRLRINGNIAWLDMLQGAEFISYLLDSLENFKTTLHGYNIEYIESNVSDEILVLLKRVLTVEIKEVHKSYITGLRMNRIIMKV